MKQSDSKRENMILTWLIVSVNRLKKKTKYALKIDFAVAIIFVKVTNKIK